MNYEELRKITDWLIENVFRNPETMFLDGDEIGYKGGEK